MAPQIPDRYSSLRIANADSRYSIGCSVSVINFLTLGKPRKGGLYLNPHRDMYMFPIRKQAEGCAYYFNDDDYHSKLQTAHIFAGYTRIPTNEAILILALSRHKRVAKVLWASTIGWVFLGFEFGRHEGLYEIP